MKKLVTFIGFLLGALCFTGCLEKQFDPDIWAVDPVLSLSASGLVFFSNADSMTVHVRSNYSFFSAESSQEWCSPFVNIDDSLLVVHVKQNKAISQRQATVTVSVNKGNKSMTRDLNIVQMGGRWDMVGDFSLFWGYAISDSQQEIISNLLRNMVYVEGGGFEMGAVGSDFSLPPHEVFLSDFYISKFEVTQQEWNAVMGQNQSRFIGPDKPVEVFSWDEAFDFIVRLSNFTGLDFRIPTEAQWEYAAKGGKYSHGYVYPGSDIMDEVAHFVSEEEGSPQFSTASVGSKIHNELGLYDMAGNVEEICADWYNENYIPLNSVDPIGPPTGQYHVAKGGDMLFRLGYKPSERIPYYQSRANYTGLRLVLMK